MRGQPRRLRVRADPHEQEILFGPLTGMQLMKTRVDRSSIVAEVRLSVNLNALTIEQVVAKLKRAHLDLGLLVANGFTHNGVPELALGPMRRQRSTAESRDAAWFNHPSHFVAATEEVFAARAEVFERMRERSAWSGTATMVQAATMCSREGEHGVATDVLRLSGLSPAEWMVEQQLSPPWPATPD